MIIPSCFILVCVKKPFSSALDFYNSAPAGSIALSGVVEEPLYHEKFDHNLIIADSGNSSKTSLVAGVIGYTDLVDRMMDFSQGNPLSVYIKNYNPDTLLSLWLIFFNRGGDKVYEPGQVKRLYNLIMYCCHNTYHFIVDDSRMVDWIFYSEDGIELSKQEASDSALSTIFDRIRSYVLGDVGEDLTLLPQTTKTGGVSYADKESRWVILGSPQESHLNSSSGDSLFDSGTIIVAVFGGNKNSRNSWDIYLNPKSDGSILDSLLAILNGQETDFASVWTKEENVISTAESGSSADSGQLRDVLNALFEKR